MTSKKAALDGVKELIDKKVWGKRLESSYKLSKEDYDRVANAYRDLETEISEITGNNAIGMQNEGVANPSKYLKTTVLSYYRQKQRKDSLDTPISKRKKTHIESILNRPSTSGSSSITDHVPPESLPGVENYHAETNQKAESVVDMDIDSENLIDKDSINADANDAKGNVSEKNTEILKSPARAINEVLHDDATVDNLVGPPKRADSQIFTSKHLTIYGSQYNIGRCIVQKWLKYVPGLLTGEFDNVNLIVMGPSSRDLKSQFEDDFTAWNRKQRGTYIVNPVITNSSSLLKLRHEFLENLNSSSLNVIIHDEAHWGIASDSNINSFLLDVSCKVENDPTIVLAILFVSATIEVITKVNRFPERTVDWTELKEMDQFQAKTYRHIGELNYVYDNRTTDITLTEASTIVRDDYLNFFNGGSSDFAGKLISDVVYDDKLSMAMIRMSNTEDMLTVVEAMKTWLKDTGCWGKVFALYLNSDSLPLSEQLRQQGMEKSSTLKYKSVLDLSNIKCFLFVIEMVRMGQRIPSTCKYYDVRSRYTSKKGIWATYLQDVGRCAGHNKPRATVFVTEGLEFPRWDQLLKETEEPSGRHPESIEACGEKGVYSRLLKHYTILKAEPQIGKTGAILSTLEILQNSIFRNAKAKKEQSFPSSLLVELTKLYSTMATENLQEFIKVFPGVSFQFYHQEMKKSKQAWIPDEPNLIICQWLIDNLKPISDNQKLYLADCGCGPCGITDVMRKDFANNEFWKNIVVYGYDVDQEIKKMELGHSPEFRGFAGNMCSQEELDSFHCVVFCLSLFEEQITRHITWAKKSLKMNGYLIIVDVPRKFEDEERAPIKGISNQVGPLRANIRCPSDQVRAEFMDPIARDTVFNALFGNSKGMYSIEDVSVQQGSKSEHGRFQVESTDKTAINLKKLMKKWKFDGDSRLFRFDLQSIFDPAQGKITVQWIVFEKLAPEDFPEVSVTAYNDEIFGKLFNKKFFQRHGNSYRVKQSIDGRAVTKNDYVIPSAVDLIASHIEFVEEVRSNFKLSELQSIAMKNVMEPRTEKVLLEILTNSENTQLPLTITFNDNPEEYEKLMKTPLSALTTRTFKYLTSNKKIKGGFDNSDYTLVIDQDVQDGIGGGYTIVYTINRQ
ncbi:hypothetical protein MP638_000186 [Amoeboaphelidium occidentale]|nr:hypothetical protein MP638_000186 [Amoeboaphelidium occidentale]